jgi:hypothetical protein
MDSHGRTDEKATAHGGGRYFYPQGRWYETGMEYLASIEEELNELFSHSASGTLPPWPRQFVGLRSGLTAPGCPPAAHHERPRPDHHHRPLRKDGPVQLPLPTDGRSAPSPATRSAGGGCVMSRVGPERTREIQRFLGHPGEWGGRISPS